MKQNFEKVNKSEVDSVVKVWLRHAAEKLKKLQAKAATTAGHGKRSCDIINNHCETEINTTGAAFSLESRESELVLVSCKCVCLLFVAPLHCGFNVFSCYLKLVKCNKLNGRY